MAEEEEKGKEEELEVVKKEEQLEIGEKVGHGSNKRRGGIIKKTEAEGGGKVAGAEADERS